MGTDGRHDAHHHSAKRSGSEHRVSLRRFTRPLWRRDPVGDGDSGSTLFEIRSVRRRMPPMSVGCGGEGEGANPNPKLVTSLANDISWGSEDNEKECESSAQLVSHYAKRLGAGQWSFLGPGSEKKWYSIS